MIIKRGLIALGTPEITYYKDRFTKIDRENRIKEAEVCEGGYLNVGFSAYRFRFEIIENEENSCIIKSTVEYELKEEYAANVSFVSIEPLAKIAETAKQHLLNIKAKD